MRGVEKKIVVAFDFGTTFSGVAYGYTEHITDIHGITNWPTSNNTTTEKVPTEFSYGNSAFTVATLPDGNTDALLNYLGGLEARRDDVVKAVKWGYTLKTHEPRVRCIKLFLAPRQDVPSFVSNTENASQLKLGGRSIEGAISDYLSAIYRHAKNTLKSKYGEALVKATKIQYVITVPANWTERARAVTMRAAMRAGITNPIPITEPEAAACYTLSSEEGQFVRAGTHIVVCDAGGGTVDLISYKVTSTKPLRLEESTVGTAGLCGSTYLNEDFRCLVKSLMGSDAYAELLRTKPKAMLSAVENFDAEVKRKFTLTDTDDYTVPINGAPNNPRIGIMDSFMTFTSDQVESVMAPTVNKVLKLIDVQVSQILKRGDHVAKVLLVGGFGQCRYLLERAQARYQGQMLDSLIFPQKRNKRDVSEPIQDRIEILQPNHAWTAVVRGAVLRGLEGDIIRGRKSRYNYGTVANVVFDRHTHGGRPFKDRHERVYYKRNVMQWFLKRGDVVRPNSTYRMNFSETWGGQRFPYARDLNVVNKVYANADDLAPTYWKETSMRLVCVLNVDLEQVPCDYFDNKQTDEGTFYWDLQYQLEMRFGDRELEFELKIGDESFGTVKAEFEAEQD